MGLGLELLEEGVGGGDRPLMDGDGDGDGEVDGPAAGVALLQRRARQRAFVVRQGPAWLMWLRRRQIRKCVTLLACL